MKSRIRDRIMVNQQEAYMKIMDALLIISTEERLWLFSDRLFNVAYDLYAYMFYMQYPRREGQ